MVDFLKWICLFFDETLDLLYIFILYSLNKLNYYIYVLNIYLGKFLSNEFKNLNNKYKR